jgi:hypothetical protein
MWYKVHVEYTTKFLAWLYKLEFLARLESSPSFLLPSPFPFIDFLSNLSPSLRRFYYYIPIVQEQGHTRAALIHSRKVLSLGHYQAWSLSDCFKSLDIWGNQRLCEVYAKTTHVFNSETLCGFFFGREKADKLVPKDMRQSTTWQIFHQVENIFHNVESNCQPFSLRFGYLSAIIQ